MMIARCKGFTLLELLVAMAIFAIMSVMAYGGLKVVLDGQERTDQHAARLAELQMFFTIMARDIEQTIEREIRDSHGDSMAALVGNETEIEFTRTGRRIPAGFGLMRSHMQRIGYVLDGDDQILRFSWHVLDRAQDSEPANTIMLSKVKGIEIRYMNSKQEWSSEWPPNISASSASPGVKPGLPMAVEVAVEMEDWGRIPRLFRVAG